jgi:hypothetical protein
MDVEDRVTVNVFRINIVDEHGAVSVVGPPHGLKVLAAACSREPSSITELLEMARPFDADWIEQTKNGLRIFDEHNVDTLSPAFESKVSQEVDEGHTPFRIFDSTTRTRSMVPARLGLVIVNLKTRRIIQIHNSYADLLRKGRGRIRERGKPTRSIFQYELPEAWSIVP